MQCYSATLQPGESLFKGTYIRYTPMVPLFYLGNIPRLSGIQSLRLIAESIVYQIEKKLCCNIHLLEQNILMR